MRITIEHVQVEYLSIPVGELLNDAQQVIHRNRIVVDVYFGLFQVIFPHDLEHRLLSVFLKGGIDGHPFQPALKRARIVVLPDLVEDHHEGVLQVVFRLLIVGGIFQAYCKKLVSEQFVQLLLRLDIALLTSFDQ